MDVDAAEDVQPDSPPVGRSQVYEVFNPDFSVGVACDRNGVIVGVHLGDEVWDNTDHWLATEVLRVARLAHLKSKVGQRAEYIRRLGNRQVADALNLPTQTQFEHALQTEFGSHH
ncbi:hypothetical protein [Nocardia sp. NPDC019395]|uniref:hypothetical protein n=1 Tax=Nocardia sp. NPDC019395 TaxID=3154686 RepID=UPI0033E116A7